MHSFDQLWSEKYAARHAAAVAAEEARRGEDFLSLPHVVCGFELRTMTPRDLLILDGIGSPFVTPGEIQPGHVAQFLFFMHAAPVQGWWARRRFFRRAGRLVFVDACHALRAYVDRVFSDRIVSAEDAPGRPLGTSFLAPLIVRMAAELHFTAEQTLATPLPQLFQYEKVLAARAQGSRFRDYSASDRLLAECLDEFNRAAAASS